MNTMTMEQKILAIPTREEFLGGQYYKYVRLEEVLATIDAHLAQPAPMHGEPVAWLRDDNIPGTPHVIGTAVRDLWRASNPKHVERYTIPLYRAQPAQAVDVGAIREVIESHVEEAKKLRHDPESQDYLHEQADKLTRAISGEKAGPVVTPGQVIVPIKLPLLKVPEIKDWLADELQIYDCPARAVWAGLLAIVTGISVDEQIAMIAPASPAPDKEG